MMVSEETSIFRPTTRWREGTARSNMLRIRTKLRAARGSRPAAPVAVPVIPQPAATPPQRRRSHPAGDVDLQAKRERESRLAGQRSRAIVCTTGGNRDERERYPIKHNEYGLFLEETPHIPRLSTTILPTQPARLVPASVLTHDDARDCNGARPH